MFCFPWAREENPRGWTACSERAMKLTRRGDLEIALPRQKVLEDRLIRIGLHRVGDRELGCQCFLETTPFLLENACIVDVERCPVALGEGTDGNVTNAQLSARNGEIAGDEGRKQLRHD